MARTGRRQSTNRRSSQRRYSAERPRKKNQRKSPYKKKSSFKKTQSWKKSPKKVTPSGKKQSGSSIIVRNLDPAVTEADVREIFSRVGKLKSAVVQYNAKGKSRGIATVTFVSKAFADKAALDYDQAEVDGRPMYVKIVNYSSPGSPTPVISKAKSVKKKTQQKNIKKKSTKKKPTSKKNQASKKKKTAKKTPKGKKATKKGKQGPKKRKRKPITAEQLDAEMDEYHSKGTGSSKTGKSSTSLIAAGQPDPAFGSRRQTGSKLSVDTARSQPATMKTLIEETSIKVPKGIKISIKSKKVEVTGKHGSLKRDFKHLPIELSLQNCGKVVLARMYFAPTKQLSSLRTVCSHIQNLFDGVEKKFEYRMRLVYAHFPINANITNGGKTLELRNFLGEKKVRVVNMLDGVTVEKGEQVKDELVVKGADIELTSRSAASIRQSCLVKHKDIRKFLDGVYVSSHGICE